MDDRDKKAKEKARQEKSQATSSKPGAHAVRDEEAARLDERIASKERKSNLKKAPPPPASSAAGASVPGAHAQLQNLEERVAAKTRRSSTEQKKPPPSSSNIDRDAAAKNRARRTSGAVATPGAHAQLQDLEDRVAAKTRRDKAPPPASVPGAHAQLQELEDRVAAKSRRGGGSTEAKQQAVPGAHAQLQELEDRVAAKSRRGSTEAKQQAAPGAHAQLQELEDRVAAKSRRGSTEAKASPGAQAQLQQLEDRVAAKSRRSGGAGSTQATPGARAQLNELEDRVASKMLRTGDSATDQLNALEQDIRAKQRGSRRPTPTTSVDDRIKAKVEQDRSNWVSQNDLFQDSMREDAFQDSIASLGHSAKWQSSSTSIQKDNDRTSHAEKGERPPQSYRPQERAPLTTTTGARGVNRGPGIHYGQYDDSNGLAVAMAVTPEEEDAFIPAAIEYDPDSKPPIYKNRRFRLYGCVALVLLAAVVTAVSIGITSGESNSAPTMAPTSYRETIGIQEQIIAVVGEEALVSDDPKVDTPQKRALDWIIHDDPMQLDANAPNLIQRYLLVVVYYSTSELGPWLSCNPPGPEEDDNCLWMKLKDFYADVKYEEVEWHRWLSDKPECYWAGCFCDEFKQVRAFEFIGAELSGQLPKEIAYLPFLQSVDFSWNNLYGTIPPEWGDSKHLLNIEVHYNYLTGTVPQNILNAKKLQRLNFAANQITGTIASNLDELTTLKGFFTFENMLTGTLPTLLGSLSFLSYTRMGRNLHTGTIPSEIGNLRLLKELWIHRNKLTGSIPSEMGRLEDVNDIRLHFNKLSGSIPDEIYNLTKLERLDLYDCAFTGTISPKVANLMSMEDFRIRANKFTGTFPTEMGQMRASKSMWLHRNLFEGTVPDELCDLRGPQHLAVLDVDCANTDSIGPPAVECQVNCCTSCCDQATGYCLLNENSEGVPNDAS